MVYWLEKWVERDGGGGNCMEENHVELVLVKGTNFSRQKWKLTNGYSIAM